MHGEADRVVPLAHARRLYEAAAEPKELRLLPGIGHIQSFSQLTYRERLLAWLDKTLAVPERLSRYCNNCRLCCDGFRRGARATSHAMSFPSNMYGHRAEKIDTLWYFRRLARCHRISFSKKTSTDLSRWQLRG